MCLAIPAQVRELPAEGIGLATVDILGVTRKISLDLIEDPHVDDWVLVHAGFAIDKVDEAYAQETLELLRSLPFEDGNTIMGEAPVPFEGAVPDATPRNV